MRARQRAPLQSNAGKLQERRKHACMLNLTTRSRNMRYKPFLAAIVALAGMATALAQQAAQVTDPATSQPVAMARILNTDAYTHKSQNGKFPTWDQMVTMEHNRQSVAGGAGLLAEAHKEIDFSAPQPLVGFSVRWDLASDGSRYTFLITENKQCGTTVMSNDSGVIYFATPLGCQ